MEDTTLEEKDSEETQAEGGSSEKEKTTPPIKPEVGADPEKPEVKPEAEAKAEPKVEEEEEEEEVVPLAKLEESEQARKGLDRKVTKLGKVLQVIVEGAGGKIKEGGLEQLAEELGLAEPEESDEGLELAGLKEVNLYFSKKPDSKIPAWMREEMVSEPLRFADLKGEATSEDVKSSIGKTLRRFEVRFGGKISKEEREASGVKVIPSVKEKASQAGLTNAERILELLREGKRIEVEQGLASGTFTEADLKKAVLLEKEAKK